MTEKIKPLSLDLSVFNRFEFKKQPVGVKFLKEEPSGIERLDKNLAFCAMPQESQVRGTPFYTDAGNHACPPGTYTLGHDLPPEVESGNFGVALQAFMEPGANRRVYEQLPRFDPEEAAFIVFSPLEKLSCDPDLLIILTDDVSQTEIIMRAMSYTTGDILSSRMTNVMGCAWLFTYPHQTGAVNYLTTGLGFGMKAQKAFPEGQQVISIPFSRLPEIVQNLEEMPWVPPSFTEDGGDIDNALFDRFGISFNF